MGEVCCDWPVLSDCHCAACHVKRAKAAASSAELREAIRNWVASEAKEKP